MDIKQFCRRLIEMVTKKPKPITILFWVAFALWIIYFLAEIVAEAVEREPALTKIIETKKKIGWGLVIMYLFILGIFITYEFLQLDQSQGETGDIILCGIVWPVAIMIDEY
tara:strand:+ start:478 stop:810 length:333 start_codon:yes stop_codon:yes gene_type:complete